MPQGQLSPGQLWPGAVVTLGQFSSRGSCLPGQLSPGQLSPGKMSPGELLAHPFLYTNIAIVILPCQKSNSIFIYNIDL